MKVEDLQKLQLPVRVKLTEGFTLEESFDVGMIVQINRVYFETDNGEYDSGGKCYSVDAVILKSDVDYNDTIAERNWKNQKTGKWDASYFDVNEPDSNGNYYEKLYVMETDHWCELVNDDETKRYSNNDVESVLDSVLSGAGYMLVRKEIMKRLKNL